MRYRDAKKLHEGDEVIRKSDGESFIVKSVEVYGQHKIVKLNCITIDLGGGTFISLFHDEVK